MAKVQIPLSCALNKVVSKLSDTLTTYFFKKRSTPSHFYLGSTNLNQPVSNKPLVPFWRVLESLNSLNSLVAPALLNQFKMCCRHEITNKHISKRLKNTSLLDSTRACVLWLDERCAACQSNTACVCVRLCAQYLFVRFTQTDLGDSVLCCVHYLIRVNFSNNPLLARVDRSG